MDSVPRIDAIEDQLCDSVLYLSTRVRAVVVGRKVVEDAHRTRPEEVRRCVVRIVLSGSRILVVQSSVVTPRTSSVCKKECKKKGIPSVCVETDVSLELRACA